MRHQNEPIVIRVDREFVIARPIKPDTRSRQAIEPFAGQKLRDRRADIVIKQEPRLHATLTARERS